MHNLKLFLQCVVLAETYNRLLAEFSWIMIVPLTTVILPCTWSRTAEPGVQTASLHPPGLSAHEQVSKQALS